MTMSNIPKPEGGFYQVGDVLATDPATHPPTLREEG
jgi:hypothetical protein